MFSNCKAVILLIEDPSARNIATAFIKICIHAYRCYSVVIPVAGTTILGIISSRSL